MENNQMTFEDLTTNEKHQHLINVFVRLNADRVTLENEIASVFEQISKLEKAQQMDIANNTQYAAEYGAQ